MTANRTTVLDALAMRRLFRFRLRTLLLGTLVFAVWLGWWVSRAREQAETVRLIQAGGGNVYYEFERSKLIVASPNSSRWVPEWLVRRLGVDFLYDIAAVVFHDPFRSWGPPPERALALERMARLRGLKDLVSISGVFDTPCAQNICRLTQLENLYVERISPADLAKIRQSLPPTVRIDAGD